MLTETSILLFQSFLKARLHKKSEVAISTIINTIRKLNMLNKNKHNINPVPKHRGLLQKREQGLHWKSTQKYVLCSYKVLIKVERL